MKPKSTHTRHESLLDKLNYEADHSFNYLDTYRRHLGWIRIQTEEGENLLKDYASEF